MRPIFRDQTLQLFFSVEALLREIEVLGTRAGPSKKRDKSHAGFSQPNMAT
jgi:hypothetical protein